MGYTNGLLPQMQSSQQRYESELFSKDELEELRRINQEYRNVDQGGFSKVLS